MNLWSLITIVVLTQGLLHYFPWRMLIGRKLPRLAAYTLGLLGMMVPLSAWLMGRDEIEVAQTLWVVICATGLTVFGLYGLDRYLELEKRDVEAGQLEEVMTAMVKGKEGA